MKTKVVSYHGYRFPPEIISHAVWLYHRFSLSLRDAEDLLAQRGITALLHEWVSRVGGGPIFPGHSAGVTLRR